MSTMNASNEKKPAHDMAFAVDKNVDDIKVAVTLFMNVAKLIALARIFVENTSEGMSQAPGPIPINFQSKNG